MQNSEKTMDKIVALCKNRGFVFPGSEIYGGLANTWDYGPLGVELKNNIKKAWWKKFVQENPYNVGQDAAILMNPQTWVASGHLAGFSDPLMDCRECHERFRADKLIEVFDRDSDLQVYDLQTNELVTAPSIKVKDVWETFPAFSADGKTLFFCAATPKSIPSELDQIRYNLCKVDFDPATGNIGSKVDTLIYAESFGKSISFPKPSYDGKFLVYTLSDYGNFSIWHHESDLWILDLATGESRPLEMANSEDTDSYHSWSSSSRWLVFSSRRDDGLNTRPYFTHIDENGNETKAFMMPQKHPLHYYAYQNRAYNVPEFVTGPVRINRVSAQKMVNSSERVPFGFRWSK